MNRTAANRPSVDTKVGGERSEPQQRHACSFQLFTYSEMKPRHHVIACFRRTHAVTNEMRSNAQETIARQAETTSTIRNPFRNTNLITQNGCQSLPDGSPENLYAIGSFKRKRTASMLASSVASIAGTTIPNSIICADICRQPQIF